MLLKSDVSIWNKELECLERRELESLQLKRLATLVARLKERVPYYRDRLPEAEISSLSQIRDLPFTTKSDLRDNYPLGMLAVERDELRRLHASSGTRGKPTIAAYSAKDLDLWSDLCARSLTCAGTQPGYIVQNSYGYGLFTGGLGIHYGAERLGAAVVPASSGRTQQQTMLLTDLQSDVLCCTPSYALNIAMALEEQRLKSEAISLKIGIFGAEPWTEACRTLLESHLRIKAYDIYGLSEIMGPGVAMECQAQGGLHIWEDHFLAEIVDPQSGEPVPIGNRGELVITTLTKEALPLVRYRTGDICSFIPEPCSCGRTMRRISRLQGRIDDMLIIKGVNVYPCEIEDVLYAKANLSPHYQIVVDRDRALDSLTVRVELDHAVSIVWERDKATETSRRDLELEIEEDLRQRLGLSAIVQVLEPNNLPRNEGKAIRVLDLRDKS